jgi:hypothetical protein
MYKALRASQHQLLSKLLLTLSTDIENCTTSDTEK